jgi:hypothetical protein
LTKKGWKHQCFAKEILLQRALATVVVLKGNIAIRTESAGEHGDVTKHRFSTVEA